MTIFRPAVIAKIDGCMVEITKQRKLIVVQAFDIIGNTSFSSDMIVTPIFFGSPPLGTLILSKYLDYYNPKG